MAARLFGAVLTSTLCLHCAHVEPPPGGPVDTQPPYVVAVRPAPGAGDVPRDVVPVLRFSEWIDRDAGRGRVLLSPPLPGKLKTRVDGDRLIIHIPSLLGGLQSNTSYRLTVLGSLKDLHGNAMGTTFSYAFTTGQGFDSGAVSGRVIAPDAKGNLFAALYRTKNRDSGLVLPRTLAQGEGKPDSLPAPWRELPAFVVPADSLGSFVFDSVAQGEYALFAFEDVNGNLAPDFGFEPMGVGSLNLKLLPKATEQSLRLVPLDTAPLRVSNVRFAPDSVAADSIFGSLRLHFSHQPDPDSSLKPERYRLIAVTGGESLAVAGAGWDAVAGEGVLELPSLRRDANYRLEFQSASDTGLRSSALEFAASGTPDSGAWNFSFLNPPDASGFSSVTSGEVIPASGYRFQSNRLLDKMRWHLLEEKLDVRVDSASPRFEILRLGPVEFSLRLQEPLHSGQTLQLRLRPGRTTPADTLFRTFASSKAIDSLKLGGLRFRIPERWKGWTFLVQNVPSPGEKVVRPGASDSVMLDPLPAGRHRLAAFLDRDGDGVWNPGSLRPWISQEPYAVLLDSLEVVPGSVTDVTARLSGAGASSSGAQ